MLSSGWRQTSKLVLIKFDLDTCTFNEEIVKNMESQYFAEGITVVDDRKVYQLTYTSGDLLVWDIEKQGSEYKDITLQSSNNLASKLQLKEGWGFASKKVDGRTLLYASDSTSTLKEIDPNTWTTIRKIHVKDPSNGNQAIPNLNELEIIQTNSSTSNYLFSNQF